MQHRVMRRLGIGCGFLVWMVLADPTQAGLAFQGSELATQDAALQQKVRQYRTAPNKKIPGCVSPKVRDYRLPQLHMTAFVPDRSIGLTTALSPTFLIYVPESRDGFRQEFQGELILRDPESYQAKARFSFLLTGNPGLVQVQLPLAKRELGAKPESLLLLNQVYIWDMVVICGPDDNPEEFVRVSGLVKRVSLSSQLARELQQKPPRTHFELYWNAGIWYEAIAALVQQRQQEPKNRQLTLFWSNLLLREELGDFAEAKVIPCCTLTESPPPR